MTNQATSPAANPINSVAADLAQSDTLSSSAACLDHLNHQTLRTYFATLNAGNFEATANLFASSGQLLPPFESAITGQDAILAYLQSEAKGLVALPQTEIVGDAVNNPNDDTHPMTSIDVVGKVQTALFTVNVKWQFLLNAQSEIVRVKIKLLASLQDLVHLRR